MMTAGGMNITTKMKLTGIMTPEKIPKVLIGSKGLKMLAKNATEVVLEVIAIALAEDLKAYAILLVFFPSNTSSLRLALLFHASMNTKMSSAAIPRTI